MPLELADAVMLASVLRDAGNHAETVFLNRNTQDFAEPTVRAELAARKCKLIGSFAGGLQYVRAALRSSP